MMGGDNLQDMLNLCYTKRWIIAPMLRDQSVAEHSFRVMVLVRCLWESGAIFNLSDAILQAMEHDRDEATTGDTPGPHKDATGDPWPNPHYLLKWEIAVKIADALETYDYWRRWGRPDVWVHPYAPQNGSKNRDIRKIVHYSQEWPEILEAVRVVMVGRLGYSLEEVSCITLLPMTVIAK